MEIKIKRKFSFYIGLVFMILLYSFMGSFLLFLGFKDSDFILFPIGAGLWSMGLYTWWKYVKNVPTVKMSDEGIRHSGKWHRWGQVKLVNFDQEQPFKYLWTRQVMAAVTIDFEDGSTLCLFDKMYRNAAEVRSYLRARTSMGMPVQPPPAPVPPMPYSKQEKLKITMVYFGFLATIFGFSIAISFAEVSDGIRAMLYILFIMYLAVAAFFMRRYTTKVTKEARERQGDQ